MSKIYPNSHVEIQGFMARHYDTLTNLMSAGVYIPFIKSAIAAMEIHAGDRILDLGCGTGRNTCLMQQYLGDGGFILGMDISEEMGRQFRQKCRPFDDVEFKNQRADLPFKFDEPFNKVFMSFVLHGFPHEYRLKTIENISNNLKAGGAFHLLDFSEFKLNNMPSFHRWIFTTFECKYAFDFVERDWKEILSRFDFTSFSERLWFKKYLRLLTAVKG